METEQVMNKGTDKIHLVDETAKPRNARGKPWVLLVVDDEEEVHAVTHLALTGFEFASRPLEIISAYSGAEAKKIMSERNDIAMILLDVVMESDKAGLDVVKYIREDLENRIVRIILRTGQPGQAPEFKVITEYDINDYKHKTELTREKMFTLVYTSLSAFRDLMALEANRIGLEKVIEASAQIFELCSIEQFTQGVLEQISAVLFLDQDAVIVKSIGLTAHSGDNKLQIVAATGRYSDCIGKEASEVLDAELYDLIGQCRIKQESTLGDTYYIDFHVSKDGEEQLICACCSEPMSSQNRYLIDLFSKNVAIAHDNVRLLAEKKGG